MRILVTGAAGFIGSNLVKAIYRQMSDVEVVGIDNMNDYYDPRLKEERLAELSDYSGFSFVRGNIADRKLIDEIFAQFRPQVVVNLAAQAGVRYSITNPDAYIESNIIGFYNILEAFGTLVKSNDFLIIERKKNLAVNLLIAYNIEKAEADIINAVFTVKHC